MKKRVLALVLAAVMVLVAFTFAACSDNKTPDDPANNEVGSTAAVAADESDLAYVVANGKLVVGITDFEPMDYKDANGNWVGFDADMAKAFAASLGVEVEFIEIDWNSKIMELNNKSIDCVWNGMTLNDEVLSSMSCSDAYCNNAQVIVLSKDVAENYQTAEACKDLSFAVEIGSAGKDMAEENGFNFTEVENQAAALMEVAAGTSDAAIIDFLMAAAMVGEGTGYENLTYTVKLNSEEYGVGFRKNSDLTDALNNFFAACAADGTTEQLAKTYGVQAALIG